MGSEIPFGVTRGYGLQESLQILGQSSAVLRILNLGSEELLCRHRVSD